MTDDQKYAELLKELGRIIKEKNDEIIIAGFQLSNLKKVIEKAETQIKETKQGEHL